MGWDAKYFYGKAKVCIALSQEVEITYNSSAGSAANPNYYKGKLHEATLLGCFTSQANYKKTINGKEHLFIIQNDRVLEFKVLQS